MSDSANKVKTLDRHECRACGYVYEPRKGDAQTHTPRGMAFEDLPEIWRCPTDSAGTRFLIFS